MVTKPWPSKLTVAVVPLRVIAPAVNAWGTPGIEAVNDPVAGVTGYSGTVNENVSVVFAVMVLIPLYSTCVEPLIVMTSPTMKPWLVAVAVAVVPKRVMDSVMPAAEPKRASVINALEVAKAFTDFVKSASQVPLGQ